MKNVHLLPTDKSSRLYLHSENELQLRTNIIRTSEDYLGSNQHIYITSNEKPKAGDWSIYQNKIHKCIEDIIGDEFKKIILTTDQDLIKDGVQAIDDEFLEWFVQNPSCEEVEVVDNLKYFNVDELRERHLKGLPHLYSEKIGYKIIIPKEESFIEYTNTNDCTSMIYNSKEEPKQETLEEAAERYWGKQPYNEDAFIEGAKWQQERMYSEEEMIDFAFNTYCYISKIMNVPFNQISENKLHAIDNLEQFKKRNGK